MDTIRARFVTVEDGRRSILFNRIDMKKTKIESSIIAYSGNFVQKIHTILFVTWHIDVNLL